MRLFITTFLLLTSFIIGGLVFKNTTQVQCDTIYENDTIFVLTGDERRIPFAVNQLNKFTKTQLYIIGHEPNKTYKHLPRIRIEKESKSTYQNALAIKKIVTEHKLSRIVLITSVDHINRALYLINSEMPNLEIAICPTPLYGMSFAHRLERWTSEYIKYIATLCGFREH